MLFHRLTARLQLANPMQEQEVEAVRLYYDRPLNGRRVSAILDIYECCSRARPEPHTGMLLRQQARAYAESEP